MSDRLIYEALPNRNSCCHISFLSADEISGLRHRHDFGELFLITGGELEHTVQGDRTLLHYGDCALIHPTVEHAVRLKSALPGVMIINVAYPAETMARLSRYLELDLEHDAARHANGVLPAALPGDVLTQLSAEVSDILAAGPSCRLEFERFLLSFLIALRRYANQRTEDVPHWLRRALQQMKQPEQLRRGLPALRHLCGCSECHLSRVMRAKLGESPSSWLLQARLQYCADALRCQRTAVESVAAAAGFANLGYFYRTFKNQFGHTPRRYRQLYSGAVV